MEILYIGRKHHPWGCFILQIGELDKKFGSGDTQTQTNRQKQTDKKRLKSNMIKWER